MFQVKEFINYQENQEQKVNDWLKEQDDKIEIIDIKYSTSTFQETFGCHAQEYSGMLIIYKTK